MLLHRCSLAAARRAFGTSASKWRWVRRVESSEGHPQQTFSGDLRGRWCDTREEAEREAEAAQRMAQAEGAARTLVHHYIESLESRVYPVALPRTQDPPRRWRWALVGREGTAQAQYATARYGPWCTTKEEAEVRLVWARSRVQQIPKEELEAHDSHPHIETTDGDRQRAAEHPSLPFTAVGMQYHGSHIFSGGEGLTLRPDPDNPHDLSAIQVLVNGVHVAYVARTGPQQQILDVLQGPPRPYRAYLLDQWADSAEFALVVGVPSPSGGVNPPDATA